MEWLTSLQLPKSKHSPLSYPSSIRNETRKALSMLLGIQFRRDAVIRDILSVDSDSDHEIIKPVPELRIRRQVDRKLGVGDCFHIARHSSVLPIGRFLVDVFGESLAVCEQLD